MLRNLPTIAALFGLFLGLAGCQQQSRLDTIKPTSHIQEVDTATPHVTESTILSTRTPVRASSSPTPTVTVTDVPLTATITGTPPEWTELAPGIAERMVPVTLEEDEPERFRVYALRINPKSVTFDIHYETGFAQKIDDWQVTTGASVVVNGGFFSGEYTPVGRIVLDGTMYGFPLNYGENTIGVAGLFTVLDGEVGMYALGRSTYSPRGMRFDLAMESYPMLLLPGRQPTYPRETNEKARRTMIGLDSQGNVIIVVSDLPIFTLHTLSGWLAESDLDIDTALNLDGGRSTGLVVSLPGHRREISSIVDLPIVLAIYPK